MSDKHTGSLIKPVAKSAGFYPELTKHNGKLNHRIVTSRDGDISASLPKISVTTLQKVEEKLRADVGRKAVEVNLRAAQLDESRTSLKKEKDALKALIGAFASEDEKNITKAKEKIEEIRSDRRVIGRDDIIEEIQKNKSGPYVSPTSENKIGIENSLLEIRSKERQTPHSADEARDQLSELRVILELAKKQKEEIQTQRNQLASALGSSRSDMDSFEDEMIEDYSSAESFAEQLSLEVQALGREDLVSAAASKISSASVARFLDS